MRRFSRFGALLLCCVVTADVLAQERGRSGRWRARGRGREARTITEVADPPQLAASEESSYLGMVVSGSPEASEVGARVLAGGGNAVDAAVATAFAIGVAEPGQSGLGGQTYLLVHLAGGRSVAIDGSAVAPLRADREKLLTIADERRLYGNELAATPGSLAALAHALTRYGTRSLAEVIEPAVELALFGSRMAGYQHVSLEHYIDRLRQSTYLSGIYLKDGYEQWEPGHVFCNFDLARTLWRIGQRGAAEFYRGGIAREMVADMRRNGGFIRSDDLERYHAEERQPLRGTYRGYEVLAFPAPCAGGAVVESLHILESFSPQLLASDSVDRLHVMLEAARLAAFDENTVSGLQPSASLRLADKRQAAARAARIRLDRMLELEEIAGTDDSEWRDRDTTHIAVADRFGNAVSLTQTLGRGFGSCTATPGLGFPYNGMLESFDVVFPSSRHYLAPLRRLFSSIAPTILLRGGRPFLILGSAGSSRIVPVIVSTVVGVVDGQQTLADAQSTPRALWSGGRRGSLYLEAAVPIGVEEIAELGRRGFTRVRPTTFPAVPWDLASLGGLNVVLVEADGRMVGSHDPRRGGKAAGVCDDDLDSTAATVAPTTWRELFAEPPRPPAAPRRQMANVEP